MHEDLGFSEQFSDDFTNISQKFLNHSDVITWLARDVVSRISLLNSNKLSLTIMNLRLSKIKENYCLFIIAIAFVFNTQF